eukprot:2695718-Prymnesium_polylepis.2
MHACGRSVASPLRFSAAHNARWFVVRCPPCARALRRASRGCSRRSIQTCLSGRSQCGPCTPPGTRLSRRTRLACGRDSPTSAHRERRAQCRDTAPRPAQRRGSESAPT